MDGVLLEYPLVKLPKVHRRFIFIEISQGVTVAPGMYPKPVVNNGITYQPQLVSLPDFWLASRVSFAVSENELKRIPTCDIVGLF